jgi:hypothetical protein
MLSLNGGLTAENNDHTTQQIYWQTQSPAY